MKIEKLTENKIRVIIHTSELCTDDTDISNIMRNAMESQDLFLDILKKAEKEVSFYTDGCKLLIEAFSSLEDSFVFTITKYFSNPPVKKRICKPTVRRKSFVSTYKHLVCCFDNFDVFCEFCCAIKNLHKLCNDKMIKNSSLYLWRSSYFLVLNNIDVDSENAYLLHSVLSEFGNLIPFSDNFESKLLEYGQTIMKKNAIATGIKFFTIK